MKAKKIVFVDQSLENSFNELSDKDPLKKAILDIESNVFVGRQVKKKLIPKHIKIKYNVSNIWLYNLPSAWRLLYSITSSKNVEIIAAVLDWMNHKDYERLFNF